MKTLLRLLVCVLLSGSAALAQNAPLRQQQFFLKNGVALQGYDAVSYFKGGKPLKGKADFSTPYGGVTYQFANAADLDAFKKDPTRYEPQYGGWCAYAMGDSGEKVEVDPETYKLADGKLFLFYNKFFTNTLTKWNKDETRLHRQADGNWAKTFK